MSAEKLVQTDQVQGAIAVLEAEQAHLEAPVFVMPVQRSESPRPSAAADQDPSATGFQPAAHAQKQLHRYMHLQDIQKDLPAPVVKQVDGVDVAVINDALEERATSFTIFGLRPLEIALTAKTAYLREHAAEIPDGDIDSAPTEVAEVAKTLQEIADEEMIVANYRFTKPLPQEAYATPQEAAVTQRMYRQFDGQLRQVLTADHTLDTAATEEVTAALRHQLESVQPEASDAFAQEVALMAAIKYFRTRSYQIKLPEAV